MDELSFVNISFIESQCALIEVKYGVNIDLQKSIKIKELIESNIQGDFGIIINQIGDYSIDPTEASDIINSLPNLKAIAIVNQKNTTASLTDFFNQKIEFFTSIKEATEWISSVVNQKTENKSLNYK